MRVKLCTYAHTQLPGGRYWEPEPAVEDILKKIKPNNDLCESILGLNDYLTTAIPNLHQLTRSNLVQVKKNKTMQWFKQLAPDKKSTIVDMAIKRRVDIQYASKNVPIIVPFSAEKRQLAFRLFAVFKHCNVHAKYTNGMKRNGTIR